MTRNLPIAIGVALMALVAVVQGFWTDRWGRRDTVEVARGVENIDKVPLSFGDWRGQDEAGDPRQLKIAKVSHALQRSYKNIRNGVVVNIYLAVGRSRNVAVHTPDKCYAAAGFRQTEDQNTLDVKCGKSIAQFYVGQFRKDSPEGTSHLRILWSWNDGHGWQAPGAPKLAFAGSPALFKMYAIRPVGLGDENVSKDPIVEFLQAFVPEVERALFSGQPAAGEAVATAKPAA